MKIIPTLFTYDDMKEVYPHRDGFNSFLRRSLKAGEYKANKKGLYALIDHSTGMIYASKFQIASRLFEDVYFPITKHVETIIGLYRKDEK